MSKYEPKLLNRTRADLGLSLSGSEGQASGLDGLELGTDVCSWAFGL